MGTQDPGDMPGTAWRGYRPDASAPAFRENPVSDQLPYGSHSVRVTARAPAWLGQSHRVASGEEIETESGLLGF